MFWCELPKNCIVPLLAWMTIIFFIYARNADVFTSFYGCSGFTGELVIPPDVTNIGYSAFAFCNGISGTLIIPSGVKAIGAHTFTGCYSLEEINVAADNVYCKFDNISKQYK